MKQQTHGKKKKVKKRTHPQKIALCKFIILVIIRFTTAAGRQPSETNEGKKNSKQGFTS